MVEEEEEGWWKGGGGLGEHVGVGENRKAFCIPARIGMSAPADKPLLSLEPYLHLQRPSGRLDVLCSP